MGTITDLANISGINKTARSYTSPAVAKLGYNTESLRVLATTVGVFDLHAEAAQRASDGRESLSSRLGACSRCEIEVQIGRLVRI